MKKKLFLIISFFVFSNSIFFNAAQEKKSDNKFVVTKVKTKKESSAHIKEDIALSLQACHEQISKNIAKLAQVQQQIFDKIKDLVGACDSEKSVFDGSVIELKEQRHKLNIFHEKLILQQEELQSFLTCF